MRKACNVILALAFAKFVPNCAYAQSQDRQEVMKQARRAAEQGEEYILNVPGGDVFVFYNKPSPFCYTYMIPGEWFASPAEAAWRSKDGQQVAGVYFLRSEDLEGFKGGTLVERAGASITQGYETELKRPLTGVRLAAFKSALPGTWKWTSDPVQQGSNEVRLPPKIIVDFSPDAVAIVTVAGTANDDGLALRILSTLKTTHEPECYFPVLDRTLKAMLEPSTESATSAPSGVAVPGRVFTNPTYRWSVSYPADWKIDATDPSNIQLSSGDGLCGFHSGPTRLKTVDELAHLAEEKDRNEHFTTHESQIQPISLPNGVIGLDVAREIRGGGQSRRVYILVDEIVYVIDCETSASKWDRYAPSFAQIIGSFTLKTRQ